ncbi:MAG: hypothetical protein QMD65_02045 [Patescibacteria group bacterium]|nr:hypothetical protein [Patescibacteria group bacterium]
MSVTKAITGYIRSKVRKTWTNKKIALGLADEIGHEGIVGQRNYDIHAATINKLLDKDDIKGAYKYYRQQGQKVQEQKRVERYKRLNESE